MDEAKAFAYALKLLSQRAYLSGALLEKLVGKGASEDVVQAVMDKVSRLGYVDDAEWARRFSQDRSRRGYGPVYIRSALRQKGLTPALIQDAVKDVEDEVDPLETACRAVKASSAFRRKPKAGEDPRRRAERCYAFLARRGFSPSVIVPALRKALKEDVEVP